MSVSNQKIFYLDLKYMRRWDATLRRKKNNASDERRRRKSISQQTVEHSFNYSVGGFDVGS